MALAAPCVHAHVLFDNVIMPNQVFLSTGHCVVTVKLAGKLWHNTVQKE
jgi:hypothetical protein